MQNILFQKYEVRHTLGAGGAGAVMLALDLHLNQMVAIKKTKDFSALTERELLRKMEHPGLPKVYDFFEEQGNQYLVMEYVEGITLKQYLEQHGRVDYPRVVKWGIELAGILCYLHEHHPAIIYRDLKPGNLMIRPDGTLKLIDLGVALKNNYGQKLEETAECAGTPGYSPPEQWENSQVEPTLDIYALGVVLHEMLTGVSPLNPPYERRGVREYNRSIPPGLERVITTCTASKPFNRYQTMKQVQQALYQYHKIGRRERRWWMVKRMLMAMPMIAGLFFLVQPLLQGVPQTRFPMPYLRLPMLCFGTVLFLRMVLFRPRRNKALIKRQEKNIWLTEKQFSGLFVICLATLCAVLLSDTGAILPGTAYAGTVEKKLWVEMRGEDNKKLLLKKDAVYRAPERVRLEIPTQELAPGRLSLQLVAVGEEGEIYTSRVFYVETGEAE